MDATATAKLALDASGFDRGLATAQTSVMRFAKTTGGLIAGAFALDKIIAGFSSAIEKGDQLQDIAEKFGVSASKLQLLGNAASVFGSGIDQVSAGLNKLSLAQQRAISGESGSEALKATFAEVGLSLADLKSMAPEDILLRISDSFASGANEGRQFIIVNELLGKAQTDLIKVLNQGSAAIIEQGENIGVYTDEQIASLSALSDSLKQFQNLASIVFGATATAIMGAVEAYARFAAIKPLIKFFDQAKPGSSKAGRGSVDVTESADAMAAVVEEKKKLDKKLYDEEIYDIQEAARLEANRDKTIFDRMMRDAEFARDEKNRILQLEKETAIKNRELVMRGMEASGTILDRVRAAAERMGMGGLIRQIDIQRQQQQRQTDISLISGIGAKPGERRSFRDNEQINALTQTEGDLQRQQNADLLNSFNDMQKIVSNILTKIDDKLGVPILKSAY
jgi:hypothetical protein